MKKSLYIFYFRFKISLLTKKMCVYNKKYYLIKVKINIIKYRTRNYKINENDNLNDTNDLKFI